MVQSTRTLPLKILSSLECQNPDHQGSTKLTNLRQRQRHQSDIYGTSPQTAEKLNQKQEPRSWRRPLKLPAYLQAPASKDQKKKVLTKLNKRTAKQGSKLPVFSSLNQRSISILAPFLGQLLQ